MDTSIKFLLIGVAAGFMVAYLYLRYRREGYNTLQTRNLDYLSLYDHQDHYKNRVGNSPEVDLTQNNPPWPVADTATTAVATILREGKESAKLYYENTVSGNQQMWGDIDPLLEIPGAPYGARC